MAQPQTVKGRPRKEVFEDYEGFVQKFKTKKPEKPKLTTDDCMTPPAVYDAVVDWVTKNYGVERENIVRPFWPGGDYKAFEYQKGAVVVDNPPFSIITPIVRYYCEHNIKFFLFAPHLTLFSTARNADITYIVTKAYVTYENGACVGTGFVTNLPDKCRIRTAPELTAAVETACGRGKRELPKYVHDIHVATAALLGKIRSIPFYVLKEDCTPVSNIDSMRSANKGPFGAAFLLSDRAAAERAAAERAAAERAAHIWKLSARELAIIAELGNRD